MFPAVPNKLKSTRAHMLECKPSHTFFPSLHTVSTNVFCLICSFIYLQPYATVPFFPATHEAKLKHKEKLQGPGKSDPSWDEDKFTYKSMAKSREKMIEIIEEAGYRVETQIFQCFWVHLLFVINLLLDLFSRALAYVAFVEIYSTHDFLYSVFETCANKYQTKIYSTESLQAVRKAWTSSIISIYVGWTQPLYIPLPSFTIYGRQQCNQKSHTHVVMSVGQWCIFQYGRCQKRAARRWACGTRGPHPGAPLPHRCWVAAFGHCVSLQVARNPVALRCNFWTAAFYFDQMWIMWQGPDVL